MAHLLKVTRNRRLTTACKRRRKGCSRSSLLIAARLKLSVRAHQAMDDDRKGSEDYFAEMARVREELALGPGDIYEDCSFHPVVCIGVDYDEDDIWGISLIDGSFPRSCSLRHCGVRKLSPEEAWQLRLRGPVDSESRKGIAKEKRWWVTIPPDHILNRDDD